MKITGDTLRAEQERLDAANAALKQPDDPKIQSDHPWLSLRDWFAGQALAGLLSTCRFRVGESKTDQVKLASECAKDVYALADAMLAHREKAEKP